MITVSNFTVLCFSGLELSLDGADQYLVNSSTLLTGIYSGIEKIWVFRNILLKYQNIKIRIFLESKLLEPEELNSLANLVVQVFVGLLECNTSLALRTLNVQVTDSFFKFFYEK